MGSGLGHLARLRPFVDASLNAGYEVTLVAKELEGIRPAYLNRSIRLFQAPWDTTPSPRVLPISWSETLLLRYRSADRLASYIAAWRSIFDAVLPDLVVYDASPTALLASIGAPWAKWTVGAPFFMPRTDLSVLGMYPNVASMRDSVSRLKGSERSLLRMIRESLAVLGLPMISGIAEILSQVDRELLTTVPELDYFGRRSTGEYLGMPASNLDGASLPAWPNASGPKIFAYIKKCRARDSFLADLESLGLAAMVYAPGSPAGLESSFPSHVFLKRPASMIEVCQQSDLVVHMGGSQTVARCLAAGLPQLLLVQGMEQLFTARSAERLGAVIVSSASASKFDEAITAASQLAARGRFPAPDIAEPLLDGSLYEQRVSELLLESRSGIVADRLL